MNSVKNMQAFKRDSVKTVTHYKKCLKLVRENNGSIYAIIKGLVCPIKISEDEARKILRHIRAGAYLKQNPTVRYCPTYCNLYIK